MIISILECEEKLILNEYEYLKIMKTTFLPIFPLLYSTCSQNISYHQSMPSRHVKTLPKVRSKLVIIFYMYHWLESFDYFDLSFELIYTMNKKLLHLNFSLSLHLTFAWPEVDLMRLHKIKIIQHIQHLFDSSYNYSCLVLFLCLYLAT